MSNSPSSPPVLPHHLAELAQGSGIAMERIQARGYRSLQGQGATTELSSLHFNRVQSGLHPGLLVPILDINGTPVLYQLKPDSPRVGKDGKAIKYETPAHAAMRMDMGVGQQEALKDPRIPLWITEGIKKVDALQMKGLCAVGLLGVHNFNGKNPYGGVTFLADWDDIALNGRQVRIVFDNDVMRKAQVAGALRRLTERLERKKAHVEAVYLPTEGGQKVGVDDFLLTHTVQDLEGCIEAKRPSPAPASSTITLLDSAPPTLTRLLVARNGYAYAATWLWGERTTTEIRGKGGEIITLSPPEVQTIQLLFVMRSDGALFSEVPAGKMRALEDLGLTIGQMDQPPDDMLWDKRGVVAYHHGERPDPKDVFERVVKVYDHFLDFTRSLGDQQKMSRLSACLSFMTWFAEAFTVLPYPWPNSPAPGSGKTKWGHCWVKTSYLGYLTSASGSFAALRDLADMGATLLFDDAEVLADPHYADPDKQALILAGNRKGVKIPVKEQGTDKRWHTRWLNAYCPRGFTALKLPFGALKSRSIVLPLLASADGTRANRDPENVTDWPVDQRALLSDLWAIGLSYQRMAADTWNALSEQQGVVGREWERWRAVIAVADMFETLGVQNLRADIMSIMSDYQDQKDDLEGPTRISLVIRALIKIVGLPDSDKWTSADMSDMLRETYQVSATQVLGKVQEILAATSEGDEEESGEEQEDKKTTKEKWPNVQAIGLLLSKLRLPRERDPSKGRKRSRVVSQADVARLAIAHHVVQVEVSNKHVASNDGDVSNNMSDMSEDVHMSDESEETFDTSAHVHVSDNVSKASKRVHVSEGVSEDLDPVETIQPEPESRQQTTDLLASASVEVGASFECLPYTYIKEASHLERVLPDLLAAQTLGVDTETSGLDPLVDRLCLVQMSSQDMTYVVDARTCPVQLLAPIFEQEGHWLIFHNAKFDLQMLVQAGLSWPTAKVLDTQLSAQVLGAGKDRIIPGAYALETLAASYLHRGMDKTLQGSSWGESDLSREQLCYAALDAQVLHPLAEVLTKELRDVQLLPTALLESACAKAFAWMELNGLPIDADAWDGLATYQAQRAQELREKLTALTGQEINWRSHPQVLLLLHEHGFPVTATNEDMLIPFVADEVVASLLEYRKASTAASTYGLKWLRHVHPVTGRVHSHFFQLGTGVGRSTSTEPNLQNIPRDPRYRQRIRVEEGRCLLKGDYSQLHLRIASVKAPDTGMQEAFQKGVDIHRKTAAGLLQKAEDQATADDRQLAKAVNFGLIYSMGAPRLQKQAWTDYGVRLTLEEAQAHKDAWFKLYPGIRSWHTREQYAISHDHITETRSYRGRRRKDMLYLPDRLSSPVLGIEADGVKTAMVSLFLHRQEFPTAKLINNIHDELLMECDAQEADAVKAWMKQHMEAAMQEALKGKASTPVEVSVGQSWAG